MTGRDVTDQLAEMAKTFGTEEVLAGIADFLSGVLYDDDVSTDSVMRVVRALQIACAKET